MQGTQVIFHSIIPCRPPVCLLTRTDTAGSGYFLDLIDFGSADNRAFWLDKARIAAATSLLRSPTVSLIAETADSVDWSLTGRLK